VKIAVRGLNQDSYGPASVGGITREVVERCDLARRRRFVNHPAVGAVVAAILRGAVKIAVRALCRKVGTLAVGVVEGVSGDFALGRELKESSVLASVRFLGNAIEVTVLPLENGIDRAAIVFDSAQAAGKRIDWCQGSTGRDLEYRSEAVFAAVGRCPPEIPVESERYAAIRIASGDQAGTAFLAEIVNSRICPGRRDLVHGARVVRSVRYDRAIEIAVLGL